MASFIRVKNWEKFQHYRQRNPPWIRLYNSVLDDYAFARLRDASKWHAVGIWLLASRFENAIPDDPAWIAQRINARGPVDWDELLTYVFIERYGDASTALADCKQNATPEESRVEESTEKKKSPLGSQKKSVELPGEWVPNAAHRSFAKENCLDLQLEADKMREIGRASCRERV